MFYKFQLYYHTIKYLRWKQVQYQIWYRLRSFWKKITKYKYDYEKSVKDFHWINMLTSIDNHTTYLGNNNFRFLNIKHDFDKKIDWDLSKYGKLWTYNLNYFEFLNQSDSGVYLKDFEKLVFEYIGLLPNLKNGNEPFPTSLRIINWIKFLMKFGIKNPEVNKSIYNQCYNLIDTKEYHLMGNHLLENGFALSIGGIFFQDFKIFNEGKKILNDELEEQILNDGAHFERSPMYHSIMLYRLLDTINFLYTNQDIINSEIGNQQFFLEFLKGKAAVMIGWLKSMTLIDGAIPHFNDSTNGIAPNAEQLIIYSQKLGIIEKGSKLNDSGFRRFRNQSFDLIIKAGKIGPNYIPGHAHADSLSFICYLNEQPIIVDPGISTYEKNAIRQTERSTNYHNTISISRINSSEVWGGFRVGKRAESFISEESNTSITVFHNGYIQKHQRILDINNEKITIFDSLDIKNTEAHFHFHPNVIVKQEGLKIIVNNTAIIEFDNADDIQIGQYQFANGFNQTISSKKLTVRFCRHLKTTITKN